MSSSNYLQIPQILRKCSICGLEAHTPDELENFVKHIECKYGRRETCKVCYRKLARKGGRYYSPISKEYRRRWRIENHDKIQRYVRTYRQSTRGRMMYNKEMRRYHIKHPMVVKARQLAKKIPIQSDCTICGSSNCLQRHHDDYNKPLEVKILCRSCHVKQYQVQNR